MSVIARLFGFLQRQHRPPASRVPVTALRSAPPFHPAAPAPAPAHPDSTLVMAIWHRHRREIGNLGWADFIQQLAAARQQAARLRAAREEELARLNQIPVYKP